MAGGLGPARGACRLIYETFRQHWEPSRTMDTEYGRVDHLRERGVLVYISVVCVSFPYPFLNVHV